MNTYIKPEMPTCLSDFDETIAINHPHLPNSRQFIVTDAKYGRGIWSVTFNKPILQLDINALEWSFEPIKPETPTSRIFWFSRNGRHKRLYMAESEEDCALEIDIPDQHRLGFVLSEGIVFLENEQVDPSYRYCIYSINTKGIIPLQVEYLGYLHSIYVLENKNQVMLIFKPSGEHRDTTEAGIFIIDATKFTVERVPSK